MSYEQVVARVVTYYKTQIVWRFSDGTSIQDACLHPGSRNRGGIAASDLGTLPTGTCDTCPLKWRFDYLINAESIRRRARIQLNKLVPLFSFLVRPA